MKLNFTLNELKKTDEEIQDSMRASEKSRESGNELPYLSCPSCKAIKCNCDLYVGIVCKKDYVEQFLTGDDTIKNETVFTKGIVYKAQFKDGIYYTKDNLGVVHRFFEDFSIFFSDVLLENEIEGQKELRKKDNKIRILDEGKVPEWPKELSEKLYEISKPYDYKPKFVTQRLDDFKK